MEVESIVNVRLRIAFSATLLSEIDAVAERESRSRFELLREAARIYVRRQKQWSDLFALGGRTAAGRNLTETDVAREIQSARRRRTP